MTISAGASTGIASVSLGARTVPLRNAKVQEPLAQARQLHEGLAAAAAAERPKLYDRVLMLMSDATRVAADDLKSNEVGSCCFPRCSVCLFLF